MLESLQEFLSTNSTLVLIAVVALVVVIGFVMYRRSTGQHSTSMVTVPTPSHDLEGLDNVNMVCDLANGVCMPQQTEEQHIMEQHIMELQQQQQQQMQQQQMQQQQMQQQQQQQQQSELHES
jgi:hypothetical protein